MNNMMIFEGNEVEVLELNGKVLFNAKHVGECLDMEGSTVRKSIGTMSARQIVKLTNSIVKDIHFRKLHNTGENFLTESGVYKLIMRSNKPEAERFQDWVTDEVLPQIRMTGGYIPVQSGDSDAEIMAKALLVAQKTLDKKDEIIGMLEPRAKNYDLLMDSKSNLDFSEFVKSAKLTIGRNRFIDVLRENKIIRCKPNTEPYQQFVEAGYFEVIQKVVNGHSVSKTTLTKKGVDWLIKKCDGWDIIREDEEVFSY